MILGAASYAWVLLGILEEGGKEVIYFLFILDLSLDPPINSVRVRSYYLALRQSSQKHASFEASDIQLSRTPGARPSTRQPPPTSDGGKTLETYCSR